MPKNGPAEDCIVALVIVDNPKNLRATEQSELAHALRAQLASVTGGLAPDAYANAWWDWYLNLAQQPPRQLQLMQDAVAKTVDSWGYTLRATTGQALPTADGDDRYKGEAWARWPFNVYVHNYRNIVDWWQKALSDVAGVAPATERTLDFVGRNA